jgi:uncharacterized protein
LKYLSVSFAIVFNLLVGLPVLAEIPTCVRLKRYQAWLKPSMTAKEQEVGLQGVAALKPHTGMDFRFNSSETRGFWMKNCLIPLDILFFRDNRLVHAIDAAPPCAPSRHCPVYSSLVPINRVIELKSNTRRLERITIGTYIKACP